MAHTTWHTPEAAPGGAEVLPELDIPAPGRQRRWTVLLRWLLLIPQFLVLAVLGVAAFVMTVAGWFGALFLGHLPGPIARFLFGYLRYETRVRAYGMLLVDRYPPFSWRGPEHPVRIEIHPTKLNRLAVFFRLILMIPAAVVNGLLMSGWYALGWIFWLITLVLGRLPEPLYQSTAAVLRYAMRFSAYVMMLTPAYPKGLFGEGRAPAPGGAAEPAAPDGGTARSGTRPLVLGGAAKVLVVLFLALGLASGATSSLTGGDDPPDKDYGSAAVPAAARR
ncbi:putative transmembrane protein [Streptomyces albus]|uniref:Putative transmembrane protein n=1 Tax=Streptomyces albus (strain ATCC 21838 / DSM 41398 / FERM P-419 / JCM 4703 / NBRC 107858) TaxID=1081613 RepID=A0A0B5F376_STRA4|nr:putative transmembrane protein [Streptomyces albus]AOU80351.1 putative transmembrane protein [Streptomyces albus]AYN36062.1 DUF4389 domain-containing protein [Streptomyces albus]